MRDFLINKQAVDGHDRGSWYLDDKGFSKSAYGGRVYCTSLAAMILEIYYRHMPLYRQEVTETDFPD